MSNLSVRRPEGAESPVVVPGETIADWLARCVVPFESNVRIWLRRAGLGPHEIDDVIQEAYARIVAMEVFDGIANPSGYFLRVARNILFDQFRRSRVVRMETVAELALMNVRDEEPDPERRLSAKQDLERLRDLVDALPDRCRQIFIMRKVDGLSQKEIGKRLGVTENTVETQVQRGLQLILKRWTNEAGASLPAQGVLGERTTGGPGSMTVRSMVS